MTSQSEVGTAGCLMQVRSLANISSAALKRLARFILNQPDQTVNLTMEELAERSGASYATIYRFCLKTGFTGYKQFKARLIEDLMIERGGRELTDLPTVDESSDTNQILDKVFDFTAKTLTDCRSIIDTATMEGAVGACLAARRILIIGSGISGIGAQYTFTKFARLGLSCHAETDGVLIGMESAVLGDGDVLLAISSTGRTVDIVTAAQDAKLRGATVVSISDYAVSPLSAVSDLCIHTTPRNASLYKDIEMPLLAGQIAVIDSLFSCMAVRAGSAAAEIYRRTSMAMDRKRL